MVSIMGGCSGSKIHLGPITSTADLSKRDNKEIPVVKEEETNDTKVFEEAVVEVVRLSKEPKSSVSPPPGSSMPPPGSSTALPVPA